MLKNKNRYGPKPKIDGVIDVSNIWVLFFQLWSTEPNALILY